MEIGTEISQKIRSAIKAKLVELGAYVDDELPDYIMVMVANKKSKKHMSDDLSLFLGHNTDKFTTWLHTLLNKLQTLSTDQQKSNEIENESKKSSDQKKKTSPSQKSQNERKGKTAERSTSSGSRRSSSEKGLSQKSDEKKKTSDSGSGKTSRTNSASVKSSNKGVKDEKKTDEEYISDLLVKGETDEFNEEFKDKEEKSKSTPQGSINKSQKVTSRVQPTTKTNSSVSSSSRVSASSSTLRSSRAADIDRERNVQTVQPRKAVPEKRKKPASVIGSSHIVKRYAEIEEEEYDPYNPAVGRVASVVKVDRRSAIPPSLQANKLLVMKAVTEAEKSCAKKSEFISKQEKLYSEKERALIKPIQRVDQTTYSSYSGKVHKEEGGLELISKSRRQELLRNMTYTIDNYTKETIDNYTKKTIDNYTKKTLPERLGQKRQPEVARVPPVMDSRFVECSNDEDEDDALLVHPEENDETNEITSDDQEPEEIEHEEVEEVNSKSTEDKEEAEVEVEEEEVDNDLEPQVQQEEEEEIEEVVEEQEEPEPQNETDPEIQQVLEDVDNDLDLGEEQDTAQPSKAEQKVHKPVQQSDRSKPVQQSDRIKPVQQSDYSKPVIQSNRKRPKPKEAVPKPVNTKFIVTLDGVEPEIFEKDDSKILEVEDIVEEFEVEEEYEDFNQDDSYVKEEVQVPVTKLTPPKITPISISLKDTDDETEEEEEEEEKEEVDTAETPLKKAKMMERCKFWPACVNGNSCTYHHPTTSCKTFPHCKFGEKCLYIHPNCKFDSKCTRKDCPFTHASRRGNLTTIIQQIVPVPIQSSSVVPAQTWPPTGQAQTWPPAGPTQTWPPTGQAQTWPHTGPTPFNKTGSQMNCKFYPNCRNMACPFNHPKLCRYGLACMNKAACTYYHPSLPAKDKLTWTAQKPSQHISERKFDAGEAKSIPTSIT